MSAIAALIYCTDGERELNLLWQAVAHWRQQGWRVAGLLNPLDGEGRKIRERVCSLTDGREYEIMYRGDTTAGACLLNPQGLAAASEVMREALDAPPDILVFNKFGHAESEGSGLIDEYAQAVAQGIAVVSLLQEKYVPEWRAFTDQAGVELHDLAGLAAWAADALAHGNSVS